MLDLIRDSDSDTEMNSKCDRRFEVSLYYKILNIYIFWSDNNSIGTRSRPLFFPPHNTVTVRKLMSHYALEIENCKLEIRIQSIGTKWIKVKII